MLTWFESARHPIAVAERTSQILGWEAASTYRPRDCYAGVAEFSVYVSFSAHGQGIGNALMSAFIPACASVGFWKLLSRIFVENNVSRNLCKRQVFREVGI